MKHQDIINALAALRDQHNQQAADLTSARDEVVRLRRERDEHARDLAEAERELAARPVVESEWARKLREAVASLPAEDRAVLDNPIQRPFESSAGFGIRCALRAFCESSPPTSAPSESNRVLGLMDRNERLREERDTAVEQRRILTEQLNAQAKSHAEEAERWSREMSELKCELEALKAAPARVEREVESELRTAMAAHPTWALSDDVLRGNVADETMRLILAGRAWLAAPLSAAPAQDEYTKAAVAHGEAALEEYESECGEHHAESYAKCVARLHETRSRFRPLYYARQRGDARAAKVEPAKSCDDVIRLSASEVQSGHDRVRWAEGLIEQLPCGHEGRNSWLMNYGVKEEAKALREGRQLGWDEQTQSATLAHAAKVEPAPAEERVTLYVRQFASGEIGIMYSQSEREREPALIDGDRWLALEATVVREGGGEKGGA